MKNRAGGAINTSPAFNSNTNTGGCMEHIQHYQDSAFLGTPEQAPEEIPV